jgi:hypothetical protein
VRYRHVFSGDSATGIDGYLGMVHAELQKSPEEHHRLKQAAENGAAELCKVLPGNVLSVGHCRLDGCSDGSHAGAPRHASEEMTSAAATPDGSPW